MDRGANVGLQSVGLGTVHFTRFNIYGTKERKNEYKRPKKNGYSFDLELPRNDFLVRSAVLDV